MTAPNIRKIARQWYGSRLSLILESIIIGLWTGFIIALFRLGLGRTAALRAAIYQKLKELPVKYLIGWIALLILTGLLLGAINIFRPMVAGGGVSQIKGALRGHFKPRWKTELPLKWIASFLGISAGLSFGWEGPSVMLGAYVGIAVLSVLKRREYAAKTLIASASAAGVSAAFGAPFAGVIFMLEEMRATMAPLSLACAMGASMTADAVVGHFFGAHPIYHFRMIQVLPASHFFWVIVLGILCALFGDIFKRSLYLAQDLFDKSRLPHLVRPVFPLLLSVPLSFFLYNVTGGGHELIDMLSGKSFAIHYLLLLLVVKLLFTAFCTGSGTSGGIFLPLLSCGALLGDVFGKILTAAGYITTEQQLNFMILGMAATFSSVIKAPVTGIVLVLEMTANFNHLGSLVLVSLSSFVTAELISSRAVYDVMLNRLLRKERHV